MTEIGIITRGHLPHWYVPGAAHFITYRLSGTLPVDVLHALATRKEQLLRAPLLAGTMAAGRRIEVHKRMFAHYDRYLDEHRSIDWLAQPRVAALVRGNLSHHHGKKYHLLAYCVMPNHVHVLLQPICGGEASRFTHVNDEELCGEQPDDRSPLSTIVHSLKSYTAHLANELLGRSGQFWQHESYDHWVRDDAELDRIVAYISANPVKAGLVARPQDWYFSSAHDRFLFDGTDSGWLGDLPLP